MGALMMCLHFDWLINLGLVSLSQGIRLLVGEELENKGVGTQVWVCQDSHCFIYKTKNSSKV